MSKVRQLLICFGLVGFVAVLSGCGDNKDGIPKTFKSESVKHKMPMQPKGK